MSTLSGPTMFANSVTVVFAVKKALVEERIYPSSGKNSFFSRVASHLHGSPMLSTLSDLP